MNELPQPVPDDFRRRPTKLAIIDAYGETAEATTKSLPALEEIFGKTPKPEPFIPRICLKKVRLRWHIRQAARNWSVT